jgi:hypothetical protein
MQTTNRCMTSWPDPRPTRAASPRRPMAEQEPKTNEDTYSPRAVLMALAVIVLLVLGCLYLFYALRDASQRQDCVMQGRSNCAPIESTTPGN